MTAPSRIVVRNIPSNITEELFFSTIDTILSQFDVEHIYFSPQHFMYPQLGGRCFISFSKPSSVVPFGKLLSTVSFTDDNGKHRPLALEYAPSQVISRKPGRDPIRGTLCAARNPFYANFLKSIDKESDPSSEVLSFAELSELAKAREISNVDLKNTPLVSAILESRPQPQKKQKKSSPVPTPQPSPAPSKKKKSKKKEGRPSDKDVNRRRTFKRKDAD
ncbi:hypothetical protein P9112_002706 [Eukaryota sp. TZLM1-RC]